jgi:hypothetical protein
MSENQAFGENEGSFGWDKYVYQQKEGAIAQFSLETDIVQE